MALALTRIATWHAASPSFLASATVAGGPLGSSGVRSNLSTASRVLDDLASNCDALLADNLVEDVP